MSKASDQYDLDAAIVRWLAAAIVGYARQYDRDSVDYPAEVKEVRRKVWARLHEVADKLRSIAVSLED